VWWIFGYPLAYGDPNKDFYSSFIAGGVRSFLPSNVNPYWKPDALRMDLTACITPHRREFSAPHIVRTQPRRKARRSRRPYKHVPRLDAHGGTVVLRRTSPCRRTTRMELASMPAGCSSGRSPPLPPPSCRYDSSVSRPS
jgi:hypothetical protein